MAFSDINQSFR